MILLPLISKLRFASIQITKRKLGQSPFPHPSFAFLWWREECCCLVYQISSSSIYMRAPTHTCNLLKNKCSYDGCLLEHLVNTGTKAVWIRLKSICEEKNNEICKSIQTDFAWLAPRSWDTLSRNLLCFLTTALWCCCPRSPARTPESFTGCTQPHLLTCGGTSPKPCSAIEPFSFTGFWQWSVLSP